MKRTFALQFALIALIGGAFNANATQVGLADWCVNVNGDTSTACNGAGSGSGSIALGSFSQTLEPGSNTLGSVTVVLAPGNNQYVAFYADYDVDYATLGSFLDSASVHGAVPGGVTYELDDPNSGNLFAIFAANTLTNANHVGTPADPPSVCCDVAFALSLSGIDVLAGDTANVTFTVSDTAPASGFYIQQTNSSTNDSIYLTESLVTNGGPPPPPPTVPEPAAFLPGLVLVGAAIALKRRRAGAAA